MMYQSTRDPSNKKYTSAEVIKMGLAPDGGLFLPETIPTLSEADIEALRHESYPVRAARILHMFLTDYTQEELMTDCHAAYREASFPGGAAPLVHVCNNLYALELWHGPTAAFKDMALQIMPRLLSRALVKTGETRHALILVATSGDTGKAALEGYRNVDRVKIMVFYPVDGVSRVQKLQMATQTGDNLRVVAIKGNFDDAQTGVKNIFADREMAERLNEHGYILSSANSINWGRLVPQIVYYISAYCDLLNKGVIRNGEEINVCVPTGNFGNILAAYYAKNMGLPINKLICASNENKVLYDFFQTGRNIRLSFDFPDDAMAEQVEDQLLLGNELMIAPIYKQNAQGRYVYLPEEMMLVRMHSSKDYTTEILPKGHHYVSVRLDELVFFIRNQKAIPFAESAEKTAKTDYNTIQLLGYEGSSYELYADNGTSPNPEDSLTIKTLS